MKRRIAPETKEDDCSLFANRELRILLKRFFDFKNFKIKNELRGAKK